MWLSILLTRARRYDTSRLTIPIGTLTLVIDNNVVSLTSGIWTNDVFGRNNLTNLRTLNLVGVSRNCLLVSTGLGF